MRQQKPLYTGFYAMLQIQRNKESEGPREKLSHMGMVRSEARKTFGTVCVISRNYYPDVPWHAGELWSTEDVTSEGAQEHLARGGFHRSSPQSPFPFSVPSAILLKVIEGGQGPLAPPHSMTAQRDPHARRESMDTNSVDAA